MHSHIQQTVVSLVAHQLRPNKPVPSTQKAQSHVRNQEFKNVCVCLSVYYGSGVVRGDTLKASIQKKLRSRLSMFVR